MPAIDHVVLEVPDTAESELFHKSAFDLGDLVQVRESHEPMSGFRGFTLSLVVSQPRTVDSLVATALEAGAREVKPVRKSFWGYGGVVQAPDGAIWKLATSTKKDKGPETREVDEVVVLLGVSDVKASKRFYVDRGLEVRKSFGSKYVELETGKRIKLALYPRRALAKDAGVTEDGSGSHRMVIGSDAGRFTDPDGFEWETP